MFESNCVKNVIILKFPSRSLNFENPFIRKMIRKWSLNSSKHLCDIVELISFFEFTMSFSATRLDFRLQILANSHIHFQVCHVNLLILFLKLSGDKYVSKIISALHEAFKELVCRKILLNIDHDVSINILYT